MIRKLLVVLMIVVLLPFTASGKDDLEDFISSLNVSAEADLKDFKGKLSVSFGVDQTRVESVLKITDKPGDAYMIFRIAEVANKKPEELIPIYQKNKNRGWGVIARELGIKPGSKEFKELKKNKFSDTADTDKGKNKGKGKGKNK